MNKRLKTLAASLIPAILLSGCAAAGKVSGKTYKDQLAEQYSDDNFQIVSDGEYDYIGFTSDKLGDKTFHVFQRDGRTETDYLEKLYRNDIDNWITDISYEDYACTSVSRVQWFAKDTPIEDISLENYINDYVWFMGIYIYYDEIPSDEELTDYTIEFFRDIDTPCQVTVFVYSTRDTHEDLTVTLEATADSAGHIESVSISRQETIYESEI